MARGFRRASSERGLQRGTSPAPARPSFCVGYLDQLSMSLARAKRAQHTTPDPVDDPWLYQKLVYAEVPLLKLCKSTLARAYLR